MRWKKVQSLAQTRARPSTRMCATHGFDAELNSFVQSYGSKKLDAALLRIPLVGFLRATTRVCWERLRRLKVT